MEEVACDKRSSYIVSSFQIPACLFADVRFHWRIQERIVLGMFRGQYSVVSASLKEMVGRRRVVDYVSETSAKSFTSNRLRLSISTSVPDSESGDYFDVAHGPNLLTLI